MGDDQPWASHARAVLDAEGRRRGAARDALIDLLAGEDCALSAYEIEQRLRSSPGRRPIGRASVYRVLDLLSEHGLVQRVDVGDGAVRYELATPGGDHHHHLVCEHCGRLVPFDDEELERSIARLSRRLRCSIAEHEVTLRGLCADCTRR